LPGGSFNLRKFTTNSVQLQEAIDESEGNSSIHHPRHKCDTEESYTKSTVGPHCLLRPGVQKILGVHWYVTFDCLLFGFDEIV